MQRALRVLLVDDDASSRRALRSALECEGFEVCEVANADEALERWAEFAPSVIVSDNRMPGTPGLEMALRIKQKVQIPMVVFSGNVDGELRDAAARISLHVVEKPDLDQLIVTVKQVISE